MNVRRKIIVTKAGGTTVGSPTRLRQVCSLITEKLQEGYFVVPVFSALRWRSEQNVPQISITDSLLDFRSIIESDGLEGFINQLWQPHVRLMRELGLISDSSYEKAYSRNLMFFQVHNKEDWPLIQSVWTEVRRLAGKASTHYDSPPSPSSLDALASGGERLMVLVVAAFLNSEWKRTQIPFRAQAKTARDVGILTDDQFGDANILQGTRYELIVLRNILMCQHQGIVPVITGFDGIHRETSESVKETLALLESIPLKSALKSIGELVNAAFRQPELAKKQVRRATVNLILDSNIRESAGVWARPMASAEVSFEEPATSPDKVSSTIQQKLSAIPEWADGVLVRGLELELSGIQHQTGFITTLGRGGSDLSATYIAKALRAEAVYLLKETDGVKTADPKVVPTAQTIRELPYELAVESGNIQSKAVRPAMEDGLAIKVLDPTNPTLFTTIGPFRLEDKLYLIPNTIRTRCISVDPPTNSTQVDLLEEILQNIRINETLELLELRCDASGIVLVVKEGYAAEYLERHIRQFGAEIHSHASWYLRVIGKVTNENTQAFTRLIASFRPLLYSIGRPDAMALSAVFPSDVESGDVVRQAHSLLLKRSNGIEQQ